jgi:hypothetical protein
MVDMRTTIDADEAAVREITNHLLHAFNNYLAKHPKTPFPDAVMGLTNFVAGVLGDQCDRMNLSPEQRESYYLAVLGTLRQMVQADIQRLTTEHYAKPMPKGVRN